MTLTRFAAALGGALALAAQALAQPVEVVPLAAPDLFSPAGRDTGLPPHLWKGASAGLARNVIALLAAKPLSPAAAALARRVLATGAAAPAGAGQDRALAGARAAALIAQGDLAGGAAILGRTNGVERDPQLSQVAAEAALLSGDDDRACAVAEALGEGREAVYWLRLRAYCQARAGRAVAAQLTFDLAQAQAKDAVYARLMGAKLSPSGKPVAASLRNGLDYALSRDLALDLAAAKPTPAVAAAMTAGAPGAAVWTVEPGPGEARAAFVALGAGDLARAQQIRGGIVQDDAAGDLAVLDAALAAAAGKADGLTLDRLVERGRAGDPKARPRAQAAALLLAGLGAPLSESARAGFAGFTAGAGKTPPARLLALEDAARAGRMGETALIALWIAADAGPAGPAAGDRAQIVRALRAVGLEADARAFALEGFLALG
ncbi:hypothetical protein [Phenylobacterium sp.]|jgi:hypothetical protein|uniref:hypothetical protein n=1 Tax=Phenylobacterium sp. TaxID=1871053 RepID=UPI002F403085